MSFEEAKQFITCVVISLIEDTIYSINNKVNSGLDK